MRPRTATADGAGRVGVLLVCAQTQPPLGADVWIHAQIIRSLDRTTHDVHVAGVPRRNGHPTPFFDAVSDTPDTHFCSLDFGEEGQGSSVGERLRTIWRTLPVVPSLFRMARYIRRHRIAVIHTTDRPRDAVICVVLGRITRTPCIVHVHVVFRDWIRGPRRWALRHADARVGVSEFVAASLVDNGCEPATTFAVRNAIDLERWTPGVGRQRARSEFGVGDDDLVILCACRLFPEKGPRELIRAIADVRHAVPDVRLWIVGPDVSPGEQFSRELDELVTELDLKDNVVLAGRRSDIGDLMAGADIYAMPSFEEPFGLVFAEAMAMELPVVGLDNGGTREVVIQGETGLLSPPGDHRQLVANLTTLLLDRRLRQQLGSAGRRRAIEEFAVSRLASDVARIYRVVA